MFIYKFIIPFCFLIISYQAFKNNFFQNIASDKIITILSSFTGAAFAYLFVVYSEKLKKINDIKRNHINSCIDIERFIIQQISIKNHNSMIIEELEKILYQNQLRSPLFRSFKERDQIIQENRNIDIVNLFFQFSDYSQFLNESSNNLITNYNEMRTIINTIQDPNKKNEEIEIMNKILLHRIESLKKDYLNLEYYLSELYSETQASLSYNQKSISRFFFMPENKLPNRFKNKKKKFKEEFIKELNSIKGINA